MEKITSLSEFIPVLDQFLNPTQPKEMYLVYGRTEVNYGDENDCNVEWCNENNIPVYNIHRAAGCCVNAEGSINIADVRPQTGDWYEWYLLDSFKNFLEGKGIACEINNNDILVDGYKVASVAGMNLAPDFDWQYTCMQISINQDLYVIEHACKNPSSKPPKGLSDWGITTEDVEEWLLGVTAK